MPDGLGPGNRQSVTAQPRPTPLVSILSTATILPPDLNAKGDEVNRWMNGLKYRRDPFGQGSAGLWGYNKSTLAEVSESFTAATDRKEIDVDPFLVYADEKLSTFGFPVNDYIGRCQRQLAVTESFQVEKEFMQGVQAKAANAASINYAQDQFLAQNTTCVTLAGGATVPIGRALSLLQQAIGDTVVGPGTIHAPVLALQAYLTLMVVTPVSPTGKVITTYLDGMGNKFLPALGYGTSFGGPDHADGLTTYGPDGSIAPFPKFWMYATGPVYIRRESNVSVYPDSYAQALNKTTNDVEFSAQRAYSVDAELRTCHFAVLADAGSIPGY